MSDRVELRDRTQVFAMFSRELRRIQIDYARTRNRGKRGGLAKVSVNDALQVAQERAEDLLALDRALSRLEAANARLSPSGGVSFLRRHAAPLDGPSDGGPSCRI